MNRGVARGARRRDVANFPAGLMAKLAGPAEHLEFPGSPGEFPAIETNGLPIQQVVMAMPYKDVTSGLLALMKLITDQCKAMSGSVEMPAGEGVKDVPVGSMLAQLESATKVMLAAHRACTPRSRRRSS